MKTWLIACCCLLSWMQFVEGQIVFESKTVEKTAALMDEKLVAEYKYSNTGKSTVTILSLKASCNCTVGKLESNVIKPGASGVVTVTFPIGNRRGTLINTITVVTDDPAHSNAILRFLTMIPEAVHVEPQFLYWAHGDKPLPKQFKVTAPSSVPVHVLQVTSSNPLFKASVKTVKDGAEYVITVEPTQTKESAKTVLSIETDINVPQRSVVKAYAHIK